METIKVSVIWADQFCTTLNRDRGKRVIVVFEVSLGGYRNAGIDNL